MLGKRLTMDIGNIFSKSPEVFTGKYKEKSDLFNKISIKAKILKNNKHNQILIFY